MSQTKHVVFINSRFFPTPCGVGDYTFALGKELLKKGYRVTVVTKKQNCPENLEGIQIRQPVWAFNIFNLPLLKREISRIKPDLVHVQYEPFGFRQSYSLPYLLSSLDLPVVGTVHEVWHAKRRHRLRDKFLYSHLKRIIVNDVGCLNRLTTLSPKAAPKTTLVGIGSNLPDGPPTKIQGIKNRPAKICYYGFLNKTKKIETLLEAFKIFLKSFEGNLEIIGPFEPQNQPYHEEIQNLVSQLGLKSKVHFTNKIEGPKVADHLRAADFVVLPFIDGASPRRSTFQGALKYGLPVLTTSSKTPDPEILPGKTALVVDSFDVESMAKGLERLATDEDLRQTLSRGALEFAGLYSWAKIVEKHLEIYEALLK